MEALVIWALIGALWGLIGLIGSGVIVLLKKHVSLPGFVFYYWKIIFFPVILFQKIYNTRPGIQMQLLHHYSSSSLLKIIIAIVMFLGPIAIGAVFGILFYGAYLRLNGV